jgi:hypothetical protein
MRQKGAALEAVRSLTLKNYVAFERLNKIPFMYGKASNRWSTGRKTITT